MLCAAAVTPPPPDTTPPPPEPDCGDLIVQPEAGEECEPPSEGNCDADCQIGVLPSVLASVSVPYRFRHQAPCRVPRACPAVTAVAPTPRVYLGDWPSKSASPLTLCPGRTERCRARDACIPLQDDGDGLRALLCPVAWRQRLSGGPRVAVPTHDRVLRCHSGRPCDHAAPAHL